MPPFVRKPSMLGDPSVVASWRFLSDATSGTTPRSTPAAAAAFQPAQAAHDGVESFLKQAESELWHG